MRLSGSIFLALFLAGTLGARERPKINVKWNTYVLMSSTNHVKYDQLSEGAGKVIFADGSVFFDKVFSAAEMAIILLGPNISTMTRDQAADYSNTRERYVIKKSSG